MASLFCYSGLVVTQDSVTAKVCDGKQLFTLWRPRIRERQIGVNERKYIFEIHTSNDLAP